MKDWIQSSASVDRVTCKQWQRTYIALLCFRFNKLTNHHPHLYQLVPTHIQATLSDIPCSQTVANIIMENSEYAPDLLSWPHGTMLIIMHADGITIRTIRIWHFSSAMAVRSTSTNLFSAQTTSISRRLAESPVNSLYVLRPAN
jgi:hypothetical protein